MEMMALTTELYFWIIVAYLPVIVWVLKEISEQHKRARKNSAPLREKLDPRKSYYGEL